MRVFTTAEALEAGITHRSLAGSRFQQLFHGVHMISGREPTRQEWIRAAQLVVPGSQPGGRTAWQVAGVDSGRTLPIVLVRPFSRKVARQGIRVQQRREWPGGLREAWAEMAGHESLLEMVTMGDRAVHRQVVTIDFFAQRWSGPAQRAAQLVRQGAESWRETWLRLCLVLAGLPEPELQVRVYDEHGREIARLDMLYEAFKVAIEYDGEQHRTDDVQYQRDLERSDDLQRMGYRQIRVTKADWPHPWQIVERVAAALTAAGAEGIRPRRTPVWAELFGGR